MRRLVSSGGDDGPAKLIGKVLDGIVCGALFKYMEAKYDND
jgi:hypothetical protein